MRWLSSCRIVNYPPTRFSGASTPLASSHFFFLIQEKVHKKKDAAQTPRWLGAPKPECR